ncbi:hypothetical protein HMPREF3034_00195 [Prevotella sp. DNF00663]|nr:hypothetical protein HMPREF3034_00195 [Prevotella sp. DNF00663]
MMFLQWLGRITAKPFQHCCEAETAMLPSPCNQLVNKFTSR